MVVIRRIIDIFISKEYNMENVSADSMVNGKKTYYSISEVCSQTGLEPHVLRYWESEFFQLRPKKNRAGNRAYRDKDIDVIKTIKHLLYEQRYTIPGAKKKLASGGSREQTASDDSGAFEKGNGKDVKKELEGILEFLTE
jgi:DNA-binding transcriptional MerR regulator